MKHALWTVVTMKQSHYVSSSLWSVHYETIPLWSVHCETSHYEACTMKQSHYEACTMKQSHYVSIPLWTVHYEPTYIMNYEPLLRWHNFTMKRGLWKGTAAKGVTINRRHYETIPLCIILAINRALGKGARRYYERCTINRRWILLAYGNSQYVYYDSNSNL